MCKMFVRTEEARDVVFGLLDLRIAQLGAFTCTLDDGSVFKMPDHSWDRAYVLKYGSAHQELIKRIFRAAVTKHFEDRTAPSKSGDADWTDAHWNGEFGDQALLAEKVMYKGIRAPLSVIAQMSAGCDVVEIDYDGTSL